MLQVTQEATAALKEARSRSGAPPEAGVRLRTPGNTEDAEDTKVVQLAFQRDPEPGDEMTGTPDLRVFVAKELIEPLSERVLDVKPTPQGPQLTLR